MGWPATALLFSSIEYNSSIVPITPSLNPGEPGRHPLAMKNITYSTAGTPMSRKRITPASTYTPASSRSGS